MDRTARFNRLFAEHRRAVHALHFASTYDAEAAADGVQETFLRIWRRLDALPCEGERAYILRTARSVAVDAARRARVRPQQGNEVEAASSGPSPHEQAAARMELDQLDAAIQGLPGELREPFVMMALGGMDSAEVSEVLGKPAGTVRYLVHQARVKLDEAMR